jgi:hypothetical protein
MICVMEAAAQGWNSRDWTARLGTTGKTAPTTDPDDRNFVIQRLEDISNSQDWMEKEVKELNKALWG